MNETKLNLYSQYTVEDHYIPALLASCFASISIIISIFIIIVIYRTKPRLHTINHLLICNTCISSIVYCTAIIIQYVYLIFIRWETSDMSCRWRAYFTYEGIAAVSYSYFLQGLSRLFYSPLLNKYRWLITFQTHYILIFLQWFLISILLLPNLLTNDIHYSPTYLCWVPDMCRLHTFYTYIAYYGIPIGLVIFIYFYIVCQVKNTKRLFQMSNIIQNNQKRNSEVLRNILILISIYIIGGIPSMIADSTSSKLPYLINLVTQVFAVFLSNLCVFLLDRELRTVIGKVFLREVSVRPFPRIDCQEKN